MAAAFFLDRVAALQMEERPRSHMSVRSHLGVLPPRLGGSLGDHDGLIDGWGVLLYNRPRVRGAGGPVDGDLP
jgi:hypothetical protein